MNLLSTIANAHSDEVRCVSIASDGTRLVSGSSDGIIKLWGLCRPWLWAGISFHSPNTVAAADLTTMRLLNETIGAYNEQVTSIDFSGDGTMIVSGSWDGTLKIWGALSFP